VANDLEAITAAALALPEGQRAALLARLMESLDDPPDADVEQAWADEIARRIEDVRSGKEKGIPWEEARKQIFGGHDDHAG
jgi:putative addiction module component (TIGR02574 family)